MVSRVCTPQAIAPVLTLFVLCACANSESPVSPTSESAVSGQAVGGAQAVGVTGVVSRLNRETRTLVVTWRGGSRLVLADGDTVVWSQRANSRVRFSALHNGQNVAIRGLDHGRYVLARSIVVKG